MMTNKNLKKNKLNESFPHRRRQLHNNKNIKGKDQEKKKIINNNDNNKKSR